MKETIVMKLNLELMDNRGMRIENREDLRRAGARTAISRETLLPGNTMLFELHFLIQRLFGWENRHLHRFSLRAQDFGWVSEGSLSVLDSLSGTLFRVPDSGIFEWKRHQGFGRKPSVPIGFPERSFSIEDSFLLNRMKAGERMPFSRARQNKKVLLPFDAAESVHGGYNVLTERLSVSELLVPGNTGDYIDIGLSERSAWKKETAENIAKCLKAIETFGRNAAAEYETALEALKTYRALKNDYLGLLRLRDEEMGASETPDTEALDEEVHEYETKLLSQAEKALKLTGGFCPLIRPIFGSILYWYDRGDEWCISVSCADIFRKGTAGENAWSRFRSAAPIGKLAKSLETCAKSGRAVLVGSDGYSLAENIGGVAGYFKMLKAFGPERICAQNL